MVDIKTVVASVVIVLSVFLQTGIRAQQTISSSSEDDSCSQKEEELEFQTVENQRLQSVLERERMTVKTLVEENQRLKLESERHPLRTQPGITLSKFVVGEFTHLFLFSKNIYSAPSRFQLRGAPCANLNDVTVNMRRQSVKNKHSSKNG